MSCTERLCQTRILRATLSAKISVLFSKIIEFIHPGLDSKDELIETLAEAEDNQVIGTDARVMLEGVLRMADRTAADIMVPAPKMDVLDINAPYDELLVQVIRDAHSRFPVYEGDRGNIIGILMAKDLLKLQRSPTLHVRALLRPASFVPETKGCTTCCANSAAIATT